jgi:hypothetical protein
MEKQAYNIIKIEHLGPEWCDRDWIMFHAMFQIIVDFVELEHPFDQDYDMSHRMTDKNIMRAKIQEMGQAEYAVQHYYHTGITEDGKVEAFIEAMNHSIRMEELFELYDWYTNKSYDLSEDIYDLPVNQTMAIEDTHNKTIDKMLTRILNIRPYLWT